MRETHPKSIGAPVQSVLIWDICLWLNALLNTCVMCTTTCGCVMCVGVSCQTKVNLIFMFSVCTGTQVSPTGVIIQGAASPSPPHSTSLTISLFTGVSTRVASVVMDTGRKRIGLITRGIVMVLLIVRHSRHCVKAWRRHAVRTVVEFTCRLSMLLT